MKMKPLFCAPILSSALIACGNVNDPGGFNPPSPAPAPSPSPSPSPSPAPTAEGLWIGTTDTNRTIRGLVLDDGTFYFLYSLPNNASIVTGFVQGSGTPVNGSFASSDARDFNVEGAGVLDATVSMSFTARQSLNGTITYTAPANAVTFTSTYDSAYEITPTLSVLAGAFTGQVATTAGITNVVVTISPTGDITGTTAGCTLSGTATPRPQGNVFDTVLSVGPATCVLGNQTFTGAAYYDAAPRQLLVTATNVTRTDGLLLAATKP